MKLATLPPCHPAADLFPLLTGAELQALADDIKAYGQREPIRTYHDLILDGRNRWLACQIVGVEPKTQEWRGQGSPTAYVLSENLHHRHLTPAQRAAVAVDVVPLFAAEAAERQKRGKSANGKAGGRGKRRKPWYVTRTKVPRGPRATDLAAAATGAPRESTEKMAAVAAKAPVVAAAVKDGTIGTVQDAERLAELPDPAAAVAAIKGGATAKEAAAAQSPVAVAKDSLDRALPDAIAGAYKAEATLFLRAANLATALVGALGEVKSACPRWGNQAQRLREQSQLIGREIRSAAPSTTCPFCKCVPSLLEDCTHCNGAGYVSRAVFDVAADCLKVVGDEALVISARDTDGQPVYARAKDL